MKIRTMFKNIQISGRLIGNGHPCFIIAEAGVNHNGSRETALELVRQAKAAGADCVKFQTFKAEAVVTSDAPKANYQLEVTDRDESQLAMLRKLELDFNDYAEILQLCKDLDITFLSTPYNEEDADFLMSLGVPGFKVASGQLVEPRFLQYLANKGLPIIMSTGMGTLAEVDEAVKVVKTTGNQELIVLQCTTNYPADIEDSNLRSMNRMGDALNVMVGYSDHVPSNYACYAAVALGANVIEKHFTLDRNMEGPDHSSSLNIDEFTEMVKGIRATERALGTGYKTPTPAEVANTKGMRRSIVLREAIPKGTILKDKHITFKRPATGISPGRLEEVLGKRTTMDLPADHILQQADVKW